MASSRQTQVMVRRATYHLSAHRRCSHQRKHRPRPAAKGQLIRSSKRPCRALLCSVRFRAGEGEVVPRGHGPGVIRAQPPLETSHSLLKQRDRLPGPARISIHLGERVCQLNGSVALKNYSPLFGVLSHPADDGLAAAVVIERGTCACCRGERPDPGRDTDRRAAARWSTTPPGCRGRDRASRGPVAAVPR